MRHQLRQYLQEQFLFEFNDDITEETDLFKAGILDSFGYIMLLTHIEDCYGVRLSEDERLGSIMVSLSRMVEFVESTRAHAAGHG